MNIAYFLKTKAEVSYLMEDFTLRQGLECVITGIQLFGIIRDDKYIGTISEGFLWFLIDDRRDQLHKTNEKH